MIEVVFLEITSCFGSLGAYILCGESVFAMKPLLYQTALNTPQSKNTHECRVPNNAKKKYIE